GNQPLAVALAEYANDTLIDVDLSMAQVDELRYAQARSVKYLEHRTIPIAQRIAHYRGRKQRLDLFLGQRLGQRAADLRHGDLGGRILADHTLANQIAEEAAEAGKLACCRARTRTGVHTPGNEILKICAGSAHHWNGALSQPSRQRGKIRTVSRQSVWR